MKGGTAMLTSYQNLFTIIFEAYVVYVGIMIGLTVLCAFVAPALSINPNRFRPPNPYTDDGELTYRESRFGFFAKVEPGMQLIIVRAGRFVTMIMDHPQYTFKGWTAKAHGTPAKFPKYKKVLEGLKGDPVLFEQAGKMKKFLKYLYLVPWALAVWTWKAPRAKRGKPISRNDPRYWDVIKTPAGELDARPVPFRWRIFWSFLPLAPVTLVWWAWKRVVYNVTGQVFVGIPGLQGPLIYPIEWFDEVTRSDGRLELRRVKDFTYFFYVREFTFWFPMDSADTRDMAGVRMYIMLTLWTKNAFKTAFRNGENWSTRVLGTGSSEINNSTRGGDLKSILGSSTENGTVIGDIPKRALVEAKRRFNKFGIGLVNMDIADRSPASPELVEAFQQEAIEAVTARSKLVALAADKKVIVETAEAVTEGGAAAALIAKYKRDENVVRSAGDRAIVSIGGDGNSERDLLAALVKESRDGGNTNA